MCSAIACPQLTGSHTAVLIDFAVSSLHALRRPSVRLAHICVRYVFAVLLFVDYACVAARCNSRPPTIPNGAFSCTSAASGGSCEATCMAGSIASPSIPVAKCNNGAWTVTGACVSNHALASCTGSPTLANAEFTCPATTLSGSVCTGSCNPGTTTVAYPSATCSNGVWNVTGSCPSKCTTQPSAPGALDVVCLLCGVCWSGCGVPCQKS